jgi:hypothetical protein
VRVHTCVCLCACVCVCLCVCVKFDWIVGKNVLGVLAPVPKPQSLPVCLCVCIHVDVCELHARICCERTPKHTHILANTCVHTRTHHTNIQHTRAHTLAHTHTHTHANTRMQTTARCHLQWRVSSLLPPHLPGPHPHGCCCVNLRGSSAGSSSKLRCP